MTRYDRKKRRMVFKRLNQIERACKKTSKDWGRKDIALATLKNNIDLGKLKITDENKEIHEWIKNFNNVLDSIYATCHEAYKKLKANGIAFNYLSMCIVIVKNNYNKGLKNES